MQWWCIQSDCFSKESIKFKIYQTEHTNEMCSLMLNQVAQRKLHKRILGEFGSVFIRTEESTHHKSANSICTRKDTFFSDFIIQGKSFIKAPSQSQAWQNGTFCLSSCSLSTLLYSPHHLPFNKWSDNIRWETLKTNTKTKNLRK